MVKSVTPDTTKPLAVSVPIPKKANRIANLGAFAHPPKKKGRKS